MSCFLQDRVRRHDLKLAFVQTPSNVREHLSREMYPGE